MNQLKSLQHNQPFLHLGTTSEGNAVTLTGSDFERHKVISGITGSGKSTFLAWIALSLLRQGIAFSLIDPHGDLCRLILQLLLSSDFFSSPKSFTRLHFIDFNRTESAIAFNVLKQASDSHTIANNVLEALHRAFPSVGTTAALDNTFLAATYVLTENKRPITDIQHLLLDASFRKSMVQNISDPLVVQFFESKLAEKANSNLIDSTMRRSFLLTFSPQLRNTLSQVENKVNFRELMDNGVSCLFSLGGLDDQSKRLLGCLLMVGLEQAFLSRATLPTDRRLPYHVIVDEFPLFSASGDSFSVILEQVRKYAGTLYLAHQTQSQLSKGIIGSLQNAIPIVMKSGTEDSSTLVSRFYRPKEENPDFFAFLLENRGSPSPFTEVKNALEARQIFENLQRQQAIVTLNGKAQKILTPTLPMSKQVTTSLAALEAAYARHLLTPIKDIGKETTSPRLYAVPAPTSINRRTYKPSQKQGKPLELFTGDLERDILVALTHFPYASLQQLASLLSREKSLNYLRKKLNSMIEEKKVAVTLLPRISGGKPLQVYYAVPSGDRKHQFLEHTLEVNEVLIAGFQLPQLEPSLSLVDLKHERILKTSFSTSVIIPDGLLSYQTRAGEMITLALEIDRDTENRERLAQKFTGYPSLVQSMGIDSLTIAFLVTTGHKGRVTSLMQLAKETLGESSLTSLFLFAAVPGEKISPRLYLEPVFKGLDTAPHALIEKPY